MSNSPVSLQSRIVSAALALLCLLAGLGLAWHYPLGPWPALLGLALSILLGWRAWQQWPLLLMALLPLLGFAPWSGWISFEEMDLLVLGAAVGSFGQRAMLRTAEAGLPVWRRPLRLSGSSGLLLLALLLALALSGWRGIEAAGGWQFGWYQGYHEAMNSLRLAKPLCWALLLLPACLRAARRSESALVQGLQGAMWGALGLTALCAIWERAAFPGLSNFSSDYRTTALFWEMHVGGAALDGCLALCLPFVLLALLDERRPRPFALLLLLSTLGVYAAVTTFSRGVFLAVPVSLALGLLLRARQRRHAPAAAQPSVAPTALPSAGSGLAVLPRLPRMLAIAAFVPAALLLFPVGGYRALLALLLCMPLLLTLPPELRRAEPAQRLIAVLLGALAALVLLGLCWPLALWLPKGGYLIFSLALLAAGWWRWRRPRLAEPWLAFSGALEALAWLLPLGCVGIVSGYWGGPLLLPRAVLPLCLMALVWPLLLCLPDSLWALRSGSERALGAAHWRSLALSLALLVFGGGLLGVVAGGDYLSQRVASAATDLEGREAHWRAGLSLLRSPTDWLIGKGLGRFPSSFFYEGGAASGHAELRPGDYRFKTGGDGRTLLALSGGTHMLGWGELFRVSQRVRVPEGRVSLRGRARTAQELQLTLEICPKHLLYAAGCLVHAVKLEARGGQWQDFNVDLGPAKPDMGGDWWAPRLQMFSVSVDRPGTEVDIAELEMHDARGQLLRNGDFSAGGAHWFSSSDRYHLPWHAKNMALHQLVEQGVLGLALLGVLSVAALARVCLGAGRTHPLAPALAAALLGFWLVGLFDSLLDVPRVAFMFYMLSLLALCLRGPAAAPRQGRRL